MASARKPYLRLKKSMVDFFRAPIVFIKNANQKFSVFEKPYRDSEYQQMHLDWPSWDWGNWSWKRPFSRPLPSATGPFGSRKGRYDCVLSCWSGDCKDEVECFIMIESGPAPGLGRFKVTGDYLGVTYSGFADINIKVDESVETARILVEYRDTEGNTCFKIVEIDCEICDSAATIGYTTLAMQINEVQTFTTSLSGTYTWAVASGGGSMDGATYTAPASNAECADNPTINLLCDGVVIDSISLAVNAVSDAGIASHVITDCQDTDPLCGVGTCVEDWFCCWRGRYNCDGTTWDCTRESLYTTYAACHAAAACIPLGYTDARSEAQITAGCCPELAL